MKKVALGLFYFSFLCFLHDGISAAVLKGEDKGFDFNVEYNSPQDVDTEIYIDNVLVHSFQEKNLGILPFLSPGFKLSFSYEGERKFKVIDHKLGIAWEGEIKLNKEESHCLTFINPEKKSVTGGCQKEQMTFE